MIDLSAQMNPWFQGMYGIAQPYGYGAQHFGFPSAYSWPQTQPLGFQAFSPFIQGGFAPQLMPQAWYGNPAGQGAFSNPVLQQVVQQIPQLVQHANQIAQQAPQLLNQLPQLIQQNPQLVQQAPQLQQVPQLLQQAAILAQQVPHVLQALCPSPLGAGRPFIS
jgi:hypothetical protein